MEARDCWQEGKVFLRRDVNSAASGHDDHTSARGQTDDRRQAHISTQGFIEKRPTREGRSKATSCAQAAAASN